MRQIIPNEMGKGRGVTQLALNYKQDVRRRQLVAGSQHYAGIRNTCVADVCFFSAAARETLLGTPRQQ